MKNQGEKERICTWGNKKYKAEEKQNLWRRKKLQRNLRDRICRCGLRTAPIFIAKLVREKEDNTIKSSIIML